MGSLQFASTPTEARVEEASIMNSKLAHRGIEGHHLGGPIGRDADSFLRCQDIKLTRLQDDIVPRASIDWLPEVFRLVIACPGKIDWGSVLLGLEANYLGVIGTQKVHR